MTQNTQIKAIVAAMKQSFRDVVAGSAGKLFEDTGVTMPGDHVWERYAQAAYLAIREAPVPSEEPVACKWCKGKGTEADYVGDDMRCVEVGCSHCNGSSLASPAVAPVAPRKSELGIIPRQFAALLENWPLASLAEQADGSWNLTVPGVKVPHPERFNAKTMTVALLVPRGFPQASPGRFFIGKELALAHGGSIPSTLAYYQQCSPRIGEFVELLVRPAKWSPNSDTLTTAVHLISSTLIALSVE